MQALYELREQKVARFIGMTSHTDGAVMAKAIEHNDVDCVQMAMNPARANRFEELALPAARKKNLGIMLMKVTAQEKLLGRRRRASRRRCCATRGACLSRPSSAACRSSSTSRRTSPRRPRSRRCRPPRWRSCAGSSPGGKARSSCSSPTTTTARTA